MFSYRSNPHATSTRYPSFSLRGLHSPLSLVYRICPGYTSYLDDSCDEQADEVHVLSQDCHWELLMWPSHVNATTSHELFAKLEIPIYNAVTPPIFTVVVLGFVLSVNITGVDNRWRHATFSIPQNSLSSAVSGNISSPKSNHGLG
ncbi:hypothetical protein Vi05172_g11490 [Venturia inaequalis]|nr:hypothetical protein Vi05172_g11490 [Venturia inaequalis]